MSRQQPKKLRKHNPKPHTCKTGKRSFATESAAWQMVRSVNAHNERRGIEKRLVNVYLCPSCLWYHTTSKEPSG